MSLFLKSHEVIFKIYPLLGHVFPQILQFFFDFFPQSIKSMKYKQALALYI